MTTPQQAIRDSEPAQMIEAIVAVLQDCGKQEIAEALDHALTTLLTNQGEKA